MALSSSSRRASRLVFRCTCGTRQVSDGMRARAASKLTQIRPSLGIAQGVHNSAEPGLASRERMEAYSISLLFAA